MATFTTRWRLTAARKSWATSILRNVRDKVPFYKETFIDDGAVDVLRVLKILKKNGFTGVITPDHAPQMNCSAPWHAGMAYALGFLRAGLKAMED
jgi:mannonate dehydratase